MKDRIIKQRFFEAGSTDFTIAISRVRNSQGTYVYMLDTTEKMYNYLDLQFPVFSSWAEAWNYVKENYPGWWNMKPFFIHPRVNAFVLLELKREIKELSIAGKKFWRNCIKPFWQSCLQEDIQQLLG